MNVNGFDMTETAPLKAHPVQRAHCVNSKAWRKSADLPCGRTTRLGLGRVVAGRLLGVRVEGALDQPDAAGCREPAWSCPTLAVYSPRVGQYVHALHSPEELQRDEHKLMVSGVEQD